MNTEYGELGPGDSEVMRETLKLIAMLMRDLVALKAQVLQLNEIHQIIPEIRR